MLSRDGWGGLAVLAASLLLFWLTLGLKDNPMVPIGPGFYPRIVLGITAVLAFFLVVFDFKSSKARPKGEKLNYGLVALMFVTFGLYCGALHYLGFRLSTFLYVAVANAMLEPPKGAKGWARAVLIAGVTAFITHLVFERYLTVLLPRGIWTNW